MLVKLAGTVTEEYTETTLLVGKAVGILVGLHVGGRLVGLRVGAVG